MLEITLLATLFYLKTMAEEPAAGGGGAETAATIEIGVPIEGRLASTDPRLPGKGPHRVFRLVPKKSGKVTIRMESRDLDAYVVVRSEDGSTLAEDDNGGPGDGALVIVDVEAAKRYDVLAAGRFDASTGNLRLEIEAVDGEPENLPYGQELLRDLEWYEEVAKADVSLARRGEVLHHAGRCHFELGTPTRAREAWDAALEVFRRTMDRRTEAAILKDIGYAHLYLGQPEEAFERFTMALEICRGIKDREAESVVLGSIGGAYAQIGQAQKAAEYLEMALAVHRETMNRPAEGLCLGNLGNAYADLGQMEKAIELYEGAIAIHKEVKNRRDEGIVLGNLGLAYHDVGRLVEAVQTLEAALDVHRQTGNRRGEAFVIGHLALVHNEQGRPEMAIQYHEKALGIYRETEDRPSEGVTFGNLGNAYLAMGKPEKAIEYYGKARAIHREVKEPRGEGVALGNLGAAYIAIGKVQEAIENYEKALEIHRMLKDPRGEGAVLVSLGAALVDNGQPLRAIECFDQALEIHQRIQNLRGEGICLANLGYGYGRLGQQSTAIDYLTKALGFLRRAKDRRHEGVVLGYLGSAFGELGQGEKAIEQYKKALEVHRETKNRMSEAVVLWNMGKVYLEQPADSLALDAFRGAHAIEREVLAGVERGLDESAVHSLGSRILQGGVVDYFRLLVKLFRSADAREEKDALLQEALDLVEGLRARMLVSALRAGDFSRLLSAAGRETWGRLRALKEKHADVVRRTLEALPDDAEKRKEALAELERESRRREDEIAALERRLKTGEPKYASLLAGERKWTPEELLGLLADGEVLLHFNVIDEQVAVFVGRRGKGFDLQMLDAGAGDLRAKVDALLADMRPRDGKLTSAPELKGRLGGLRAELLRGLEEKLEGARSILVVPDGFLHLFPFEALVLEDGRYLVEKLGVRYAPSLQVLLELERRKDTAAAARLVLAGDPDFGKASGDGDEAAVALRIRGGRSFRRLEHAREEIDRIAGLFEERIVLSGANATESRFREEAPRGTFLHVATHGRYEQVGDGSALFYSGLAFAGLNGGGDGKEDGFLTAAEVMALDLRPVELVVLSACDTAAGALKAHEGKFGLERAFFVAGVRAFVGSLWRVDDGATAELMVRFYRHLLDGKPRAQALRLAKVDFIRGGGAPAGSTARGGRGIGLAPRAGGDRSHPYYWAAFVLSGDGRSLRRGR